MDASDSSFSVSWKQVPVLFSWTASEYFSRNIDRTLTLYPPILPVHLRKYIKKSQISNTKLEPTSTSLYSLSLHWETYKTSLKRFITRNTRCLFTCCRRASGNLPWSGANVRLVMLKRLTGVVGCWNVSPELLWRREVSCHAERLNIDTKTHNRATTTQRLPGTCDKRQNREEERERSKKMMLGGKEGYVDGVNV